MEYQDWTIAKWHQRNGLKIQNWKIDYSRSTQKIRVQKKRGDGAITAVSSKIERVKLGN